MAHTTGQAFGNNNIKKDLVTLSSLCRLFNPGAEKHATSVNFCLQGDPSSQPSRKTAQTVELTPYVSRLLGLSALRTAHDQENAKHFGPMGHAVPLLTGVLSAKGLCPLVCCRF